MKRITNDQLADLIKIADAIESMRQAFATINLTYQ